MRIGIFFSGENIKNYEVRELNNLLKTKNKFIFFFEKSKKIKEKNFFLKIFDLIFIKKFFSLIILEEKISNFINKKNSFSEKLKKLNKKKNLNLIINNFYKYKKYYFECCEKNKRFKPDITTIKKIKNNCDMIIFLGFNKLVDQNFLKLTKYGVLSFHTADINFYRGRPAGFYEFINNEKFGGVTLQRLNENIDSGEIIMIKKINIKNCKSYQETVYRMMSLKNNMLAKGLNEIKKKKNFYPTKNKVKLSIEKDSRKLFVVLKCLYKTMYMKYLI